MTEKNEAKKSVEISAELRSKMLEAGRYEELLSSWKQLAQEADFESVPAGLPTEEGRDLRYWLNYAYGCFSKQNAACDSAVKQIWQNQKFLAELDAMNIPREFLLQTVRVGALKDQMEIISGEGKHRAVELYVDLNGYSWANGELIKLQTEKTEQKKIEKEIAKQREAAKKEQAIAEIGREMNTQDFSMTTEQKKLLRHDFELNCKLWKALNESSAWANSLKRNTKLSQFFLENGQRELTPEITREFQVLCEEDKDISRAFGSWEGQGTRLKFQMLNPESGWFYVAKKNKVTTLKGFLRACTNNMDSWMEL